MIRKFAVQGACVDVECLVMGLLLENNVYLIGDGSATFVVDPTCKRARHPRGAWRAEAGRPSC